MSWLILYNTYEDNYNEGIRIAETTQRGLANASPVGYNTMYSMVKARIIL